MIDSKPSGGGFVFGHSDWGVWCDFWLCNKYLHVNRRASGVERRACGTVELRIQFQIGSK